MKGRLAVVCRPAVAPGFALAGIGAVTAESDASGAARVEELAADPDVAVVLVEDRMHDALGEEARRRLVRSTRPLVVSFPGAKASAERSAEDVVLEILRRAVGYRVKLR